MRELLNQTAEIAARYLETLDGRGVAPTSEALARLAELNEPLPGEPSDPAAVLEKLDRIGSPATMGMAGRAILRLRDRRRAARRLWRRTGWPAAWDQNAGLLAASPIGTGWRRSRWAGCWTCWTCRPDAAARSSPARPWRTSRALAAARHAVLARAGWDVEADGLFGAPPITVVVGDEEHPSLIKALGMLGLGRAARGARAGGRPGPDARRRLPRSPGRRSCACRRATSIPARSIRCGDLRAAHRAGAWVHVDGAFGLWAAAAPRRARIWSTGVARRRFLGHRRAQVAERALRQRPRLRPRCRGAEARRWRSTAPYLPQRRASRAIAVHAGASRRARGVEVWAALRVAGPQRAGRTDRAQLPHWRAASPRRCGAAGFEILNDVVLNQVLVSFGDAARTRRVIARVQEDGTCWCGRTEWQGRTAMRISVSSWATRDEDVDRSVAAILRAAAGAF